MPDPDDISPAPAGPAGTDGPGVVGPVEAMGRTVAVLSTMPLPAPVYADLVEQWDAVTRTHDRLLAAAEDLCDEPAANDDRQVVSAAALAALRSLVDTA